MPTRRTSRARSPRRAPARHPDRPRAAPADGKRPVAPERTSRDDPARRRRHGPHRCRPRHHAGPGTHRSRRTRHPVACHRRRSTTATSSKKRSRPVRRLREVLARSPARRAAPPGQPHPRKGPIE
ncbi:UNVERIFIED_CONTAM: hypothetical protein RF648_05690 [Kocuria sp. CPCC 205274]